MRGKLLFAAGLAAGYVIGARAGRSAYVSLSERVHDLSSSPTAHRVAEKAKEALEDRAPRVANVAEQVAGVAARAASGARSVPKSGSESDSGSEPQDTAKPSAPDAAA